MYTVPDCPVCGNDSLTGEVKTINSNTLVIKCQNSECKASVYLTAGYTVIRAVRDYDKRGNLVG